MNPSHQGDTETDDDLQDKASNDAPNEAGQEKVAKDGAAAMNAMMNIIDKEETIVQHPGFGALRATLKDMMESLPEPNQQSSPSIPDPQEYKKLLAEYNSSNSLGKEVENEHKLKNENCDEAKKAYKD